jgi:hypothetical protein
VKICNKCAEQFFGKVCKRCQREYNAKWYVEHKEQVKKATAIWQTNNPEKVKEIRAKCRVKRLDKARIWHAVWYKENKDRAKENAKIWVSKNKTKVKISAAKTRIKLRDKLKKIKNQYRAAHPKQYATYQQNRRARTRGRLSNDIAERLFKLQDGKCACCRKPLGDDYHLDHIQPLALGGKNEDGNIQLLHATCNLKKGAKHPVDFMQELGFLL